MFSIYYVSSRVPLYFLTFDYNVYSIFEFAWTFDINMKGTRSAVSPLTVSLQPLNPRQAMVKRLSVVNLENFRKQYARRRWKVKYNIWSAVLCFSHSHQSSMLLLSDFRTPSLCFYLINSCHSELLHFATTWHGSWRRATSCPSRTG